MTLPLDFVLDQINPSVDRGVTDSYEPIVAELQIAFVLVLVLVLYVLVPTFAFVAESTSWAQTLFLGWISAQI